MRQTVLAFAAVLPALCATLFAQGSADHPSVTVDAQVYTPSSILARNIGSAEDQETAFPPHKILGNIYYVGILTLGSFLIVTPNGDILLDTTYERNAEVIHKSVDTVTLGGTTLVARLTAGHTAGATTWTLKASEGGKSYDVVFFRSLRVGGVITPVVAAAFDRSFALVRTHPVM